MSFEMWQVTNEDSPTGGEEEGEAGCELRNVAGHKQGLTSWREGRWRSKLVSFEMWHIINKDSLTGGEEEGEAGW